MSIVSGIVGAISSSNADKYAQDQNAANTTATNQTNQTIGMMRNGASVWYTPDGTPQIRQGDGNNMTPHAILPYYTGNAETDAAGNAANLSAALQGQFTPSTLADYQAIVDSYNPQYAQTNQTAADVASGATGAQMVAEGQPVWNQRVTGAKSQSDAMMQALHDTLAENDLRQAKRGFSGDNLASNLVGFRARSEMGTARAAAMNNALLTNAQERQGLQQAGRNLQLSNLTLPDTMANAALRRTGSAAIQLGTNFNTALQPLNFFRNQQTLTPYAQLPTVQPISMGAGVASAVGGLTGGLANAYFKANPNALSGIFGSGGGGGSRVADLAGEMLI